MTRGLLAVLMVWAFIGSSLYTQRVLAAPGDSMNEPALLRQAVRVGGWKIAVTEYSRDARDEGFRVDRVDGASIAVSIIAENISDQPMQFFGPVTLGIINPDGVGIEHSSIGCSEYEKDKSEDLYRDVFPGGVVRADLCWILDGVRELPDSVLMYAISGETLFEQGTYAYFLLSDDASPTPTPSPTPNPTPTPSPTPNPTPTPASGNSSPAPVIHLTIEVGLRYLNSLDTCTTKGVYSDIASGRQVIILDSRSQSQVFTTLLGKATSTGTSCSWTFSVPNLQSNVRYEVRTPSRHIGWLDPAEADTTGNITLAQGME